LCDHRRRFVALAAEEDEVRRGDALDRALRAGEREKARALCKDIVFLEEWCREAGVEALEEGLRDAGEALGDEDVRLLCLVIGAESRWLREEPGALGGVVYNRLRSAGWEAGRIRATMRWADRMPAYGLRYPLTLPSWENTLVGHSDRVDACG
jgi:hypothetical protein